MKTEGITMRKLVCFICVIMVFLSMVACSGENRESAKSVVENGIKAFQRMDHEEIKKYWIIGDEDVDFNEFLDSYGEDKEFVEQLFFKILNKLTYNIIENAENEEQEKANVTVEFENVDMEIVMSKALKEVISLGLEYAFLDEDKQPSQDEINQMALDMMSEIIEENNDNKVQNSVDISLLLIDNKWKMELTYDILDAMLGDYLSYYEYIIQNFGGTDTGL